MKWQIPSPFEGKYIGNCITFETVQPTNVQVQKQTKEPVSFNNDDISTKRNTSLSFSTTSNTGHLIMKETKEIENIKKVQNIIDLNVLILLIIHNHFLQTKRN